MRVLIIGYGSIARKHIAALNLVNVQAKIFALRSSKSAPIIEGVINVYSYDEVEDLSIDFALISNPTSLHMQTIKDLLRFEIPLFIEKPAFHKLDSAAAISTLLKEKGIKTYIGCNLRFLDCIKYMYKLLNEQELRVNEVNAYSGSYLPSWRPGTDYKQCYSANKDMGGGAHLDLVHEIDYVYWLFGSPNKVKSTLRSVSSLEINAIDYAHYNLNYDTFCADITLNYFRKISKRKIEILTSEDIWEVNLLSNSVYRNGEEIFKSDQTILDTYEDQMKYFIDLCNEDKVSMNSFKDAIEVMKICLND